ncbi:tryptophan 7-halogenase [Geoglobus acetivorans]|uniref:Geranylgeranyl diphosphate reductase n=1 Tax=Geoglobus acetivorans TaxID=565033 RepID=A0A0A7GFC8_GEOAI|nr:Geranylgeranyl diphosphate reductase [Geoglobus acetivorans]
MLVSGGGVAGSTSAINIGEKADVTIVEAKLAPGFPVKCGGLISEDCYRAYSEYVDVRKALLNHIKGAFFFSPTGKHLELYGSSGAVVIERKIFDQLLLREASNFSEVIVKSKVDAVGDGKARIITPEGERFVEFDVVIGADGAESRVARDLGFRRPEFFVAKQYLMEFEVLDENMVELYFGKSYSDGFFAYAIPLEGDLARVGVVSRSNPEGYLRALLEKHPDVSRRRKGGILEVNAGAIPAGLAEFVRANAVLIGDSAGMVKPYTGGGLYYLLRASEILGEVFPDLQAFRKSYLDELGKEYRTGESIQKLYGILDDSEYDFLIEIGRDVDFSAIHMDSPSSLLRLIPSALKVIRRPTLIKKIAGSFL